MESIDSVLASYVHSKDEVECSRLLEEIMLVHAAPLVRRIIRQRLGVFPDSRIENSLSADAADLYNEIATRIVQRLKKLKEDTKSRAIGNFTSYVNHISRNACHDYLRQKYPVRYMLKNRIRYLLAGNKKYRLQKAADGIIYCEVVEAMNDKPDADTDSTDLIRRRAGDDEIVELVKERANIFREKHGKELAGAVDEILRVNGEPMELDRLVGIAARVIESHERAYESIDDESSLLLFHLPDSKPRADENMEGQERLRSLWEAILTLPIVQRRILFLSRVDDAREDLWSILLESEIVTLRQLGGALDITQEEIVGLWPQVPMETVRLAEYLNISRGEVTRWKFYARRRLKKTLSIEGEMDLK